MTGTVLGGEKRSGKGEWASGRKFLNSPHKFQKTGAQDLAGVSDSPLSGQAMSGFMSGVFGAKSALGEMRYGFGRKVGIFPSLFSSRIEVEPNYKVELTRSQNPPLLHDLSASLLPSLSY